MVINFFPPAAGGGVYRPLSFVRHLSVSDWDVTVLTPAPGEFWIEDPSLLEKVPENVRIVRTRSLSGQRVINRLRGGARGEGGSLRSTSGFGLLRKIADFFLFPDTYIGWYPFAVRAAVGLMKKEKFDAVYSTSPPDSSHFVARNLSRTFRVPWVADFRDPWINLYLKRPPTPVHRAIHNRLQSRVFEADRLLVTTDWHLKVLKDDFHLDNVVKIANGYDEDDFSGTESITPVSERFEILHCGMLTLGRTSRPFLSGLARFLERNPSASNRIHVSFIGARESKNEYWVRRFSLENVVSFENNLPHDECIKRERGAHVLLLIKHDDPMYTGLVPGKLYEYIGARRPVLAVVPGGEAAQTVRRLRRGEVADISDPSDVAQKIDKMYTLYTLGQLDLSYDLSTVDAFTRRVQAQKLLEVLDELVS